MPRIVLATHNRDKLMEIQALLARSRLELVPLNGFDHAPQAVEDGDTLRANALKKAEAAFAFTGLPSVADDTGLEVDALGGEPGVRSSRYAGPRATYAENVAMLLAALRGVPAARRGARFRCAAVVADARGHHAVEGVCEGMILESSRGFGGFGYDPVFYVPAAGKTFAEMTLDEKNVLSHRAVAFRKMGELLDRLYGNGNRGVAQSG